MRRSRLVYLVFLYVLWGTTITLFVGYFFLGWFNR
jgi:hypothetical protein